MRTRPKRGSESVESAVSTSAPEWKTIGKNKIEEIVLKIKKLGSETDMFEKLGLIAFYSPDLHKYVIAGFTNDGPARKAEKIEIGDVLLSINNKTVDLDNIERILNEAHAFPLEVVLRIEKRKSVPAEAKKESRTTLVRNLLETSTELDAILQSQPIGVAFVNLKSQTNDRNDLIYGYPPGSAIFSSRGSFVTLFHLLSDVAFKKNICSSSVYFKNQRINVLYVSEEDHLLLIAIPKNRCDVNEASYIVADLLDCLRFNHRSFKEYFETSSSSTLNHFFSIFFCRILTSCYSTDASRNIIYEKIETSSKATISSFEDLLPYARKIPLPKKLQMQVDDVLNQIEANDAGYEDQSVDFQRPYIITGSCFYHKGFLLASHFSKEDLSSIHSFCRQNGLIQLFRNEPVKSLVVWREVFPSAIGIKSDLNGGSCARLPSVKRWFLLIVGQECDAIVFLLESCGGSDCEKNAKWSQMISYIEEAEDTLDYLKLLDVSKFASYWLSDNLNGLKSFDGIQKGFESMAWPSIEKKYGYEYGRSSKNRKISYGDISEDSTSQAPSNVSEISDENVPILGRRAERRSAALAVPEPGSDDSGNSDSDWESFKENITMENLKNAFSSSDLKNGCSKLFRLTANTNNSLFYYVHLNGSQGILITPNLNWQSPSNGTKKLMQSFRKAALAIHSLLENNVRFKKNDGNGSKTVVNKSLIAVKEQGLRLCCTTYEADSNSKKCSSFFYWVIGRLFFTPQRREVYVCHYDDVPQHLVEIAFRLGLDGSS